MIDLLPVTRTSLVLVFLDRSGEWCTTAYIADQLQLTKHQVANALAALVVKGSIEQEYPERGRGRKAILQRYRVVKREKAHGASLAADAIAGSIERSRQV